MSRRLFPVVRRVGAASMVTLLACLGPAVAQKQPVVRFEDVTSSSGVKFRHFTGATGEKYMQECMGSGLALFDADGDGWIDIYLMNGSPLTVPGSTAEGKDEGGPAPVNALYRNGKDGTFTDTTAAAGVGDPGYGMGAAVGDYDADGDDDLYVINHGPNVLYRNDGDGTFTDVTTAAGVGDSRWGSSAVFFDGDGDGDLDLFLVNYCDSSVENHKWCGRKGREWRAYCTPQAYEPIPDVYFRNEGNGRFVDGSAEAGLIDRNGKGLGVVPADFDRDGDTDLYVANDSTPNQLWRNEGDGRFRETGLLAGVAYSEDGRSEAGMGVDAGDYDGDGLQDLLVTNLDYETNSVLLNKGKVFVHVSYPAGVAAESLGMVGFGINWLDVENDGDLDIFVANGHIIDNIAMYNDSLSYAQGNHLFLNNGDLTFREVGGAAGVGEPNVARGSAVADLNRDGRLDVVVSRNGGPPGIFLNKTEAGHWLQLRTRGTRSNRPGYGAVVTLDANGRRQVREVRATTSYQSSSDRVVHFGIGQAQKINRLTVAWPSGLTETFPVAGVDKLVDVVEGTGNRVSGGDQN